MIARCGRSLANLTVAVPFAQRVDVLDDSIDDHAAMLHASSLDEGSCPIYSPAVNWLESLLAGVPRAGPVTKARPSG
jgi:hypothetical protein